MRQTSQCVSTAVSLGKRVQLTLVRIPKPVNSGPRRERLGRAGPFETCGRQSSQRLASLDAVVDDYISRCRDRADGESRWFAIQKSLDAAIENAGMARAPSGKRLSHQRRIPKAVLRVWTDELMASAPRIKKADTFAKLHDLIAAKARELHGIGQLSVYDTARRLGAFLRLEPERVYLHAGTREGARLFGLADRDWLLPSDLPRSFRRLTAGEIEDCLCIYRDELATIIKRTRP